MTRLVSVITPVHAASLPRLSEAFESLRSQVLPEGWDWEWIVQEDGQDDILQGAMPGVDPRIRPGSGRAGGPAMARTMALARARGEFVKVLDADDMLMPGVLERDIGALMESGIGWSTSRVMDLMPDGTLSGFAGDPPGGQISQGDVLDYWRSHDYRAPVHPATLCIRRKLLLALGGWMALPASEDTGMLLAASVVSDGYFSAEPGLLYRKWSGQVTGQPAHVEPAEREARMRLIDDRARALSGFQWQTPLESTSDGSLGSGLIERKLTRESVY